ncbi:MAG: YfhO family protein [Chloroflexi bacterium]|nr:YfhO family protein [Chloroflexota bacterium]
MADVTLPRAEASLASRAGLARLQWLFERAWRDSAVVAMYLFGTALFYWRIITPDAVNRASFPKGDFIDQFYPFAFFRAQELLAGRIPLWQPYALGGHPFVADIQSAVFYPLSWFTILIRGAQFPFRAYEAEVVFHIFLAAVFAYAFGMVLFRNRFAAAVAGLVFAFSGYLTSYPTQCVSILEVEVWLPLILLFAHLATRPRISARSQLAATIGGGLALGLSALAGHPQAFMYVVYGTVAYLAFRLAVLYRDQGKRAAFAACWVLPALLIVGIGLAAIQLVPTYEFMRVSTRDKLTYGFTSGGFPLKDILQIALPGSVSVMSPMYVGIFPVALAVLAIQFRRAREVLYWVFFAGLSLAISFGGNTFLYSAFYLLAPGFSTFRDQERAIYLTSFAAAQLAGYGALLLAEGRLDTARVARAARVLLVCGVGALALLGVIFILDLRFEKLDSVMGGMSFLSLLLLLGYGLLRARENGLATPLFSLAAVALIVFDLFSVNWKNNLEEKKPEDHYVATPLVRYLQEHSKLGRVYNEYQIPLNYGLVYGVEDIMGASPLVVKRYKQLEKLPWERWWQILNVRYLVTWRGDYPLGKKILTEDKIHLYELPDPLPRASVIHEARVEPSDEKALAILGSAEFDPRNVVVLADDSGLKLSGQGAGPSEATFSSPRPDRLLIETQIDKPGILLVSEVFYPGWKVKVDGKPSKILRADVTLRGVALDPGRHVIEMTFEPASFKVGYAITGLTLLSSIILLVAAMVWRRRRPS